MGPFWGALIRPVGGWLSDKVGGAKVTQLVSIVMMAAALGVANYMNAAYKSATPEEFFWPFFIFLRCLVSKLKPLRPSTLFMVLLSFIFYVC